MPASHSPPALRLSVVEPSGLLYGSELALLDILEQLDRSSVMAEIILPRGAPIAGRIRAVGVPVHECLCARADHTARLVKAATYLRLAWHWHRHRPDLIYVNQGGILRPMAALARHFGLPILCQVQTLEDARWVSSLRGCHAQVATFVCNSEFIAAACQVPPEKLSTVYYGYKPKGLRRTRAAALSGDGQLEIGLLGRICEGKGHYLVIEAARRLRDSGARGFHFRFIGEAPTAAERARVQAQVQQAGVGDLVEFRGYRADIAAELAQLDLLVIPSFGEPFGRILCEAAEAAVPVLLADAGGLGELSRRFDVGLRFPAQDVTGFLAGLQHVLGNYAKIRADFVAGAQRLLRALPLDAYIKVVEKLIARSAARQPSAERWLGAEAAPRQRGGVEA